MHKLINLAQYVKYINNEKYFINFERKSFVMSTFIINSFDQYKESYNCSVENPTLFWDEIAQHYTWFKPYHEVYKFSMEDAQFSWFNGGETNITFNCLDRHLPELADKTAIVFEPNDPSEPHQEITYAELVNRVAALANVLLNRGVRKGDRVCIYLPMIPELAISLLACARIGAIHSVVFAGFSYKQLTKPIFYVFLVYNK
jgi:acetyl-CoA synthetase